MQHIMIIIFLSTDTQVISCSVANILVNGNFVNSIPVHFLSCDCRFV